MEGYPKEEGEEPPAIRPKLGPPPQESEADKPVEKEEQAPDPLCPCPKVPLQPWTSSQTSKPVVKEMLMGINTSAGPYMSSPIARTMLNESPRLFFDKSI